MMWRAFREVSIPEVAVGMRLDRFLAQRFRDRSRSFFAARIRAGEVLSGDGIVLTCSHRMQRGTTIRVHIEGIAPSGPPPPFPTILHDAAGIVAVDKPSGMLAHPAGTDFSWAVVSLAKARWPDDRMDLAHRLDRDTSGVLLLTRDLPANRHLKAEIKGGRVYKEYEALVRGEIPWESWSERGPIGPAGGPIRIQMGVCADGQSARTDVTVLGRRGGLSRVRCVLHTGRTHQIRVHLAHLGHPVIGDRMYGVPPDVFLSVLEGGVTPTVIARAGAPRHALHAARTTFVGMDGEAVEIRSPVPPDLARWWADPGCLPEGP